MNGSIKRLGVLMVTFGLAGCGGGAGVEKVAPRQSLIGVWEGIPGVDRQSPKDTTGKTPLTHALMISADSTYAEVVVRRGQPGCGGGQWALKGTDSVSWNQGGGAPVVNDKIVFQDKQFFLYRQGDLTKPAEAYRRADTTATPKPKHLSALPQCANTVRQMQRQGAARRPTPAPRPAPTP